MSKRSGFAEHQLLTTALEHAGLASEPHPTLVQHVAGPRDLLVAIASDGNEIFETNRCFLIAIRGTFVLYNASRPVGAAAPRGTVLWLVVDAASGRVLDRGVGDHYPELERLGSVVTDLEV